MSIDQAKVFKIISLVISGLSLIPYGVFLFNLIIRNKAQDKYKLMINIMLLISCFLQSLYYPLHEVSDNNIWCSFLGSIDICVDYCKLSLSIIKTIIIFHDYIDIFEGSDIKGKTYKLWVINIGVSIILPLLVGILTFFLGNIGKTRNNLCYPNDLSYGVVVYIGFLTYYVFFFALAWTILVKIRNQTYPLLDSLNSNISFFTNDRVRLKILLCYSIMIIINCLLYLGFIFMFVSFNISGDNTFALVNQILGRVIEPLTIPIFFVLFEINDTFVIEGPKSTAKIEEFHEMNSQENSINNVLL